MKDWEAIGLMEKLVATITGCKVEYLSPDIRNQINDLVHCLLDAAVEQVREERP